MRRVLVHTAFAALMCGAAVAQEARPALIDLAACRIDDAQVRLSFKFESSPCWDTTDPVIAEGTGEPADTSVTIGTVATSGVCTMNIVIAEYDEALPVAAPLDALEVTLTTPDGNVIGMSTVAVAAQGSACTAPVAVAASQ